MFDSKAYSAWYDNLCFEITKFELQQSMFLNELWVGWLQEIVTKASRHYFSLDLMNFITVLELKKKECVE